MNVCGAAYVRVDQLSMHGHERAGPAGSTRACVCVLLGMQRVRCIQASYIGCRCGCGAPAASLTVRDTCMHVRVSIYLCTASSYMDLGDTCMHVHVSIYLCTTSSYMDMDRVAALLAIRLPSSDDLTKRRFRYPLSLLQRTRLRGDAPRARHAVHLHVTRTWLGSPRSNGTATPRSLASWVFYWPALVALFARRALIYL
jgi:hypothetical protein